MWCILIDAFATNIINNLKMKIPSYHYIKFNCGDKMVISPFYNHDGNSYIAKTLKWFHDVNLKYHVFSIKTIHHDYVHGQPNYSLPPSFQTCQSQAWCSGCMFQAHQDDISHDETHNESNFIWRLILLLIFLFVLNSLRLIDAYMHQ